MTASSPEADLRMAVTANMEAQAHAHAMAATMMQAGMTPPVPPGARTVPSPNTSRPGSMGQARPAVPAPAPPPPKPNPPAPAGANLEDAMKSLSVEEKAPGAPPRPRPPRPRPVPRPPRARPRLTRRRRTRRRARRLPRRRPPRRRRRNPSTCPTGRPQPRAGPHWAPPPRARASACTRKIS